MKSAVEYQPGDPPGREISSDSYFRLMADRDGVGFVHCGDGVLVLPMASDGRVWLALERSPAFDREVLGLVGGSVEPGEPLEESANRELQEELGWRAERIEFLGELHPFKYLTTRQFLFLARDLVPSRLVGDERYAIKLRAVALHEWPDLCRSGELGDAMTIAALCLAERHLGRGDCGARGA